MALLIMVADLTIGREKYAAYQDTCKRAREKAMPLYQRLAGAVDEDTDAYNLVSGAFKMPKDTEAAKAARSKAIAHATLVATEVPFRVMQDAYEGMKLVETMLGNSNPNAASDLGVAGLSLSMAVRGAWLNVKTNLPGVKEEARAKAFAEEGQRIYQEARLLAERLENED